MTEQRSIAALYLYNKLSEDGLLVGRLGKAISYYVKDILKIENFKVFKKEDNIYIVFCDINGKELRIKPKYNDLQNYLIYNGFSELTVYYGLPK